MTQLSVQPSEHFYFIGIGGISMSALALLLKSRGCSVSGTDIRRSAMTEKLEANGIHVNIGHRAENITPDVTQVVYTAAVKPSNPEIQRAEEMGIFITDRAHLLGRIMSDYPNSIAIAGTHGKTTTSSMISEILLAANTDPTITIGGVLPTIGSNLKVGNSSYFVAEACEYFDSFLQFSPRIGVILNIEADHLDYFKTLENIRHSFHAFAQRISPDGLLVVSAAIPHVEEIIAELPCRVETFSLNGNTDWCAGNVIHEADGTNSFDLIYHGKDLGKVHLRIPGEHNITNALAACAAATFLQVPFEDMQKGLSHFVGTERRFQRKGIRNGVLVVDDYGHHPTEIRATLAAAQNVSHHEIWCVFQPHTYSRTKFLFDDFSKAFQNADHIILADIYAARETDDGTIHSSMLAEKIRENGKDCIYGGSFEDIVAYLNDHCVAGDLVLTVGAGDVYRIGEMYLADSTEDK